MKKKTLALLLAVLILLACGAPAFADGSSCVVLGADLSAGQIATVYQLFGIERGSVDELTLTNAEERAYLEGFVDESVIGTRAISCVYVELRSAGEGLSVETCNISWCTPEMYASALETAGITDARIVVAAPFEVSGTAALGGIYKAYESITGSALDESAKSAGTRELTVTGQLAEQIGEFDAENIISGLKEKLGETEKLSDEELREKIRSVAANYNVTFSDRQVEQILDLFRAIEKLDPSVIRERVEEAQQTINRLSEAKEKATDVYGKASGLFEKLGGFFSAVWELLGGLKELLG